MVIIRKGRREGETLEGGGGVDIRGFDVALDEYYQRVKISFNVAIKVL